MDFDDLIMKTVMLLGERAGVAREVAEGLPLRDGGRVSGHQPRAVQAGLDPRRRARQYRRGGRPGSVDLRVPRRRHPQHRRVRARLPQRPRDRAGTELSLDPDDPRCCQRGDRPQLAAPAQAAVVGSGGGRRGAGGGGRGRARRGALPGVGNRTADGAGLERIRHRRVLPDERAVAGAGGSAGAPVGRLPRDRRPALLRAGRDQGCDRLPAAAGEPRRRGVAAADREPAAPGHRRHLAGPSVEPRPGDGSDAVGGDRAGRGRAAGRGATTRIAEFRALIQELQIASTELGVSALLEKALVESGYMEMLEADRTIEAQGRMENLQELVGVAQEYEERGRRRARWRRSFRRSRWSQIRMRCRRSAAPSR